MESLDNHSVCEMYDSQANLQYTHRSKQYLNTEIEMEIRNPTFISYGFSYEQVVQICLILNSIGFQSLNLIPCTHKVLNFTPVRATSILSIPLEKTFFRICIHTNLVHTPNY